MKIIFRICLWIPAWFFVLLAIGAYAFGLKAVDILQDHNVELAKVADEAAPEFVDYSSALTDITGEIALNAQFDQDIYDSYHYENDGPEDYVEYYFFLRDVAGKDASRDPSAVVIFETDQVALIDDWFERVSINNTVFEVRGIADDTDYLDYEVSEVLQYHGARRGENFVYIRPFLEGRDAYFANSGYDIKQFQLGVWIVVAGLLGWAVVRHFIRNLIAPKPHAQAGLAKTAFSVASGAAGLVGFGEDEEANEEEDAFDLLGDAGKAMGIGKVVFRFLLGKKKSEAEPSLVEAPDQPSQIYRRQNPVSIEDMELYTPPRQQFLPDDEWPEAANGYLAKGTPEQG